jgi:predicted CopG family antitoxin
MNVKAMPRMDRTIKITDEVHKALIEIGGKSETFSDVIMRLIEYYKKHQKR